MLDWNKKEKVHTVIKNVVIRVSRHYTAILAGLMGNLNKKSSDT
jgi:hypothetical protein